MTIVTLEWMERMDFERFYSHPLFIQHQILGQNVCIDQEIQVSSNKFIVKEIRDLNTQLSTIKVDQETIVQIMDGIHLKEIIHEFKVAGLEETGKEIYDEINIWMRDGFRNKSILISGKSGSGKTILMDQIVQSKCFVKRIMACDLFRQEKYETESNFISIIKECILLGPSILIIEDFEVMVDLKWDNESIYSSHGARLLQLYIGIFDDFGFLEQKNGLLIIATTNTPQLISKKVLDLFDKSINLNISSQRQRLEILKEISKNSREYLHNSDELLDKIAHITHGFVGADLLNLYRHVFMNRKDGVVGLSDFKTALQVIKPAGAAEFSAKIPDTKFSDIYGLEKEIAYLMDNIITPFVNSSQDSDLNISRGILIHGPSGTGKSELAFALINELGLSCIYVDAPKIRSKIVGESESNIIKIFNQAKSICPCIILIDQIDMVLPTRGFDNSSENTGERMTACFLSELDRVFALTNPNESIFVIGITSRIEAVDHSVYRSKRLENMISISLPDLEARRSIFTGYLSMMPNHFSDSEIDDLVDQSHGWTGADIESFLREAALKVVRAYVGLEYDLQKLSLCADDMTAAPKLRR